MSYAAMREREKCEKMKELICNHPGEMAQMLMGEDYHVSKYKREAAAAKDNGSELPELAEPLALSKDEKKVKLLTEAFQHVASLKYWDEPDYDLIQRCLHGFLEDPVEGDVDDILWDTLDESSASKGHTMKWKEGVPTWQLQDDPDIIEEDVWVEAEAEKAKVPSSDQNSMLYGSTVEFSRLPVEWQYRIAQMEYTAKNYTTVDHHVALRDFMQVALPLVYGTWDSNAYERPLNVKNREMYLREVYFKLINKCLAFARKFNNFEDRSCFYDAEDTPGSAKRRKITWDLDSDVSTDKSEMVALSRVLFALEAARQSESRKGPPPL